jgi:NAD(P)-dependent dehydrogenase (short-subunit alcohol dehydrogenase family)
MKRVFLTGASTGIGLAIARAGEATRFRIYSLAGVDDVTSAAVFAIEEFKPPIRIAKI